MMEPAPIAEFVLELFQNHAENLRSWKEYNDVDRAIKRVIKIIVPEVYFWTLQDRCTGYVTVRSLEILTQLHVTYGMIEDEYIQAIDTELKATTNGETHFEDFVAHIEYNQEAVATQKLYTTGQTLSIIYNLFFKVGFYPLECKEWRHKDAPDKTWTTFKINFAWSFKEVRKERANSGTRAYAANMEICGAAIEETSALTEMAQDTTTALENLATATNTDRNKFNELT